jgi:predicted molibdopterin-dependent oxidoreductase YjgC
MGGKNSRGSTQTRRSAGLSDKQPEGFVEIHPKNARRLGVQDGQMVDVVTRRSRVKARAMVSRQVRYNRIWMPFHFPEMRTNELTVDAGDAVTGTGEYKVCAARIEPIPGAAVEKVFPGSYASA